MIRALIVFVAVCVGCAVARAQDGSPTDTASASGVDVVAVGTEPTLSAMAARIAALQSRLRVALRWSVRAAIDVREIVAPQGSHAGANADALPLARVWLDLTDPSRAVLFIANRDHDRFLVRVVPVGDGYGELTLEALATIVETATEALLAGGEIGVARHEAVRVIEAHTGAAVESAVEAAPTPIAAAVEPNVEADRPRNAADHTTQLSLHYRGDAIDAGPRVRHGVQLAITWVGSRDAAIDLLVGVSAQYNAPCSLGSFGAAQSRVTEHGGGARAWLGVAGWGALHWQAALTAGVDVSAVTTRVGAGLVAEDPFVIVVPMLGAFVSGALPVTSWLDVTLGVGVEVDLSARHFDVRSGNARITAVSPWTAHPYVIAGVTLSL